MSIYYFGELVGEYKTEQKQTTEPALVGDIIKKRDDYQALTGRKKLVVRHYEENFMK